MGNFSVSLVNVRAMNKPQDSEKFFAAKNLMCIGKNYRRLRLLEFPNVMPPKKSNFSGHNGMPRCNAVSDIQRISLLYVSKGQLHMPTPADIEVPS
jgi:hypothetical protein